MNILLINPPLSLWPATTYPSIYYIKGFLKKGGFDNITTLDLNVDIFHHIVSLFCKLCSNKRLQQTHPRFFYRGADTHVRQALGYLTQQDIPFDRVLAQVHGDSIVSALNAVDAVYGGLLYDFGSLTRYSSVIRIIKSLGDRHFLVRFYREHLLAYKKRTGSYPDFIGISLVSADSTAHALHSYLFAKVVKQLSPKTHICFGGPLISKILRRSVWRTVRSRRKFFTYVDSYVAYEAEHSIVALLNFIQNDEKTFPPSSSIVTRDYYGVKDTSPGGCDVNYTPDYDDLDFSKLFNIPPAISHKRSTQYLTFLASRGCYWRKCAFCSSYYVYGKSYRNLRVDSIIDSISHVQEKYGCSYIRFGDEAMSPSQMEALSTALIRRRMRLHWSTNIRADAGFLNKGLLQHAKKAGLEQVFIGIESASPRMIKRMNKGYDIETAELLLSSLHDSGIVPMLYLIVGFPGEKPSDLDMTYQFVLKNYPKIAAIFIHPFQLEEVAPIGRSCASDRNLHLADFSVGIVWGGEYPEDFNCMNDEVNTEAAALMRRLTLFL